MDIQVIHNPTREQLDELGVDSWPIWEKEVSYFPWTYDSTETCYILEGVVTVTPTDASPVKVRAGDLVIFPEGMSCHWDITEAIRKHYHFA